MARGANATDTQWHPAGHTLLSSGDDLEIAMWDASNSFELKGHYRTGHSRNVFCVKYVPNQDSSFVSCGMDGDVRLTDLVAVRCRASTATVCSHSRGSKRIIAWCRAWNCCRAHLTT